jgi:hypothetical protein
MSDVLLFVFNNIGYKAEVTFAWIKRVSLDGVSLFDLYERSPILGNYDVSYPKIKPGILHVDNIVMYYSENTIES